LTGLAGDRWNAVDAVSLFVPMHRRLFVVLLALAASPALAKSLHWQALDVTARLDRDGRLHVSERQAIVFDGDWNGGERTFRVGAGQSLKFESIARVEDGADRKLSAGGLGKIDHYSFTSPTVLRWRSRLPDDPPFDNKEITYVLNYSMSGVLRKTDGAYNLNHDFAFPDRAGLIERYSLRLDLDPAWHGAQSPIIIQRKGLVPGESVVVTLKLEFAAQGAPAGTVNTLSRRSVYGVLALFVIAMAFLLFDFVTTEHEKGRFARILPPDAIDEAWLEEHLFALKPEAAGAAIDGKTGPPEVAAMLARMTQEGKISSTVETRRAFLKSRQVLCLTLLVDRNALTDGEGKLVRALFFDGDATDTDKIRAHYKNGGFNPASIVEGAVTPELQRIKGWGKNPRRADWKRSSIALGAIFVLLIVAAMRGGNDTGVVIFVTVAGAVLLGFAAAAASANSSAVTGLVPRFAIPALLLAPLIWLVVSYSLGAIRLLLHFLTPLAICAWAAAITKMVLDVLRSPQAPETIALRKRLIAARNYFISELRSPQPRLRDEWYPYLLAFGLGKHVDRWFGAFGSGESRSGTFAASSSSASSGSFSSQSPSFTGGGGAFGGAGASGGWAVAAVAIGAGVAAPSSSGSGGSSGGGGGSSSSGSSSSGGGGGGGW
jgi:uncharacterized membrane protein YgcG